MDYIASTSSGLNTRATPAAVPSARSVHSSQLLLGNTSATLLEHLGAIGCRVLVRLVRTGEPAPPGSSAYAVRACK